MEAPEQIYLTKNLLGELRDGWDALPSEGFTNIEYTCTDTFIEKAIEWLQYNILFFNDDDVEDFREYMKGE